MKKIFSMIILAIIAIAGFIFYSNNTTDKDVKDEMVVLGAYRNLAPGKKDAYYCSKILYVWEPLVTKNEKGEPAPSLAESWEFSKDRKEIKFNLRKDVTFHDGTKFDADAVIKNFDRMKMGLRTSGFYPLDMKIFYPNFVDIKKINDNSIKLVFSKPVPTQIYNMVDFGSPIFSPKSFDENGDFKSVVQGTGPFKITKNILNEYVLLERNEKYYGQKAKVKRIMIKVIPNVRTRYSALVSGEILGVLDLNAITPNLALELKNNPDFKLTQAPSTMNRFLAINGAKYPFNDVKMRQAISLAIDRKVITKNVYNGFAKSSVNLLNYSSPYHIELDENRNLQEAKKLANEVLKGKRVAVKYMINGSQPLQKNEAELISIWLKEIGVDVEILPLEYTTMAAKMKKGEFDIARIQQGLAINDPLWIFNRFMNSKGDRNISCHLNYNNAQVDKILQEAKYTIDTKKRINMYNQLQKISSKDLPVIPLFDDVTLYAYNKKLTGYKAQSYGLDLTEIDWAEK